MDSIIYDIVWPGGNTTAIVRSHVPVMDYVDVAKRILAKHSDVEQVGYLLAPYHGSADGRLAMMGGEFCGNATRSAAFILGSESGKKTVQVEIPGLAEPLQCALTDDTSAVVLPLDFCESIEPCPEGHVVDLHGIRHVVITEPTMLTNDELLERYKNDHAATGLIFLKDQDGVLEIDPFVWVRDTETFYHETACGSGTIAVGFVLKAKGQTKCVVRQPSGSAFQIQFGAKNMSLIGSIKQLYRAVLGQKLTV